MKDKKGLLPAHVACMRHCSPEKLRMLLEVNPGALREPTNAGATLLSLAKKSATKAHPNYALIDELNRQLVGGSNNEPENTIEPAVYPETVAAPQANYGYQYHPFHVHQNPQYYQHYEPQHHQQQQLHRQHPQQHAQQQEQQYAFRSIHDTPASMNPGVGRVSSEDEDSWNRARLDSNDSNVSWSDCYYGEAQLQQTFVTPMATRARQKVTTSLPSSLQPSRKRKSKGNPDGVDLLLHFSRNSNGVGGSPPRRGRNGGFEMELQPSAVEHIPATGHEEKEDWGEKHVRSGRVAEV